MEKTYLEEKAQKDIKRSHGFIQFLQEKFIGRIIVATVLFILLLIVNPTGIIGFVAYFGVYLLIGSDVIYQALRNISQREWFDESFLMAIATLGAFAIDEYPEAIVVMLFYQIGEYFQHRAVEKSRKSIAELMDIRPSYAHIVQGDETFTVAPDEVKLNDLIVVKPGELIPLDGIVVAGESLLDTAALTGEALPRKISVGDEVLSGVINKNGLLTIRVTALFEASTVSKILHLVENATTKKAPTEKFITKFAHYYTPIVVFAALVVAFVPPLFFGFDTFSLWLERALTFLVISCPCALVISVPLGFFGGIGLASKRGILIKGGNFLEALSTLDTVIFDKTGTLTQGQFVLQAIHPTNGFKAETVLEYATYGEWFSNHPIARAIKAEGVKPLKRTLSEYHEIPGQGVQLYVDDTSVFVGNETLMANKNIAFTRPQGAGTFVYVAVNDVYAGVIIIADAVKEDAKMTITALHERNIRTIMLSGDNEQTVAEVAEELGISEYYASLLPQDKVEKLELLLGQKTGAVMFVGDGINDAPVLALADIGVSMGNIGSDAAIEASDIVLMSDNPRNILTSIKISHITKKIVWQNIIFALVVKLLILGLGAFGYASMWAAVFADIGVSFIAIMNSIRITQMKV